MPLAGLTACAGMGSDSRLRVDLVGLDSLPGEGLELRFAVKLRLQNPGEHDVVYSGVSFELDLRGMSFASGVSPAEGRVPRFGEAIVELPVTVSAFAMARQLVSLSRQAGTAPAKVDYQLRGRLGGGLFGAGRFESHGDVNFAAEAPRGS
jgi:hypothetical protein